MGLSITTDLRKYFRGVTLPHTSLAIRKLMAGHPPFTSCNFLSSP
jgi:hypothetical protein